MKKIIFVLLLWSVFICGWAYSSQPRDRVLIIAPHPDDEAIGCAGIIQQAQKAGADVHILYLTNGDHNQLAFMVYEKRLTLRKTEFIHMGEVRRKEAIEAMKSLGLSKDRLIFLGYPDFGTFNIFRNFWQMDRPYKSILTRVSYVPYKQDLSFGKPYTGQSILADFETVLRRCRPNKIFVTTSLDTNPDHKAAGLFLEIALANLHNELPEPEVYTYLIHWKGWPLPRNYHPKLALLPPVEFQDSRGSKVKWVMHTLTAEEIEAKRRAVLCYKSQTKSGGFYLLAFCRKDELFAKYPVEEPSSISYEISDNLFTPLHPRGVTGFTITLDKPRDNKCQFGTLIYLFGYSHKTTFDKMPKIRIITKYNRLQVFNGRKKISAKDVLLKLEPDKLSLSIPLSLLGEPDFILASVRQYPKNPHVDSLMFRKVKWTGRK